VTLGKTNVDDYGDMQFNSQVSHAIAATTLVYRTKVKKVICAFDAIFVQNLSDILPLFCTPIWLSHRGNGNQE